ncbi:MAG: hypothetical protein M3444_05575 [Acidobacteriota bacterium]|nr:hypothetical protein [Acidobacteriota bacterium]
MNYDSIRRDEFECVAMPHTERLLRAALRMTGERGAAEDLVQETLLRAWRSFDQLERGTNCKAWLFRIMLNISGKNQRSSQARPALVSFGGLEPAGVIPMRRPEVTSAEVLSALDSLSPERPRGAVVPGDYRQHHRPGLHARGRCEVGGRGLETRPPCLP